MLTKGQMEKYGDVLLWGLKKGRKGRFKKGDVVLVRFDRGAIEMAEVLHAKLLEMGINPVMRSGLTPTIDHDFYRKADGKQLGFVGPWERSLCENLNGKIYLHAPESLTHLSDIDPARISKTVLARKPLRDILREREEAGIYGWTLCALPTEELAREAKLSLRQYTNQIVRACYLDKPDPVKAWEAIYRAAMTIKRWLADMDVRYYHIESEKTDLKITPGRQRKWVGISGHNIPSFEIFISPDWRGTEGRYYANQPSFRSGNYVEGVYLTFKNGQVVSFHAKKGKQFLSKQLSMDKGGRRIGEFSLTDKRFSRINRFMANTLYDENYGGASGNCHLAVGSSYTDCFDGDPSKLTKKKKEELGFNDSALHWDLVNTEKKKVTAYLREGQKVVIYENGLFQHSF